MSTSSLIARKRSVQVLQSIVKKSICDSKEMKENGFRILECDTTVFCGADNDSDE
ncbi:hypothetical protein SS1G_02413 [Sclerotinia sclerotiorum 1980 UF-70]|uniref:Uncharacterized protein n=1 Tax=Sclerotinia sclerotiorum (strain ATCC 18683 / 1980 / Ss-1) TaxID=665079 RepID=A7EAT1_SCLS1|nr:hypothetical protein SS1G_02413 [Sclerotinia sclerotiorum 1980 UF-70]EDN99559.1 hypothetical protein SS1G_02413 [Sclerotinia sclerotiorum 1980 UF-70]